MSIRDSRSEAAVKSLDANESEIESIVRAESSDPFHFLGPHWLERDGKRVLTIRAYHPGAIEMAVEWMPKPPLRHSAIAAEKIHPGGVFEAIVQNNVCQLRDNQEVAPASYRLHFRFPDRNSLDTSDAYAFPPQLTDYDLYLSGEGTHYQKYEKLGAHVRDPVRELLLGRVARTVLRLALGLPFGFARLRGHEYAAALASAAATAVRAQALR